MAAFRSGSILAVLEQLDDLVRADVVLDDGTQIAAAGFTSMLGPVDAGNRVVVNTTGIELGLGTGGVGFLLWNLDGRGPGELGPGHIVKLRYTPWQANVLAAEEPDSPHHAVLATAEDIAAMPVVACGLHSQVAGVAAGIKAARPDALVGYLMTDGASLPLQWSDLVRSLRAEGLVDVTCTSGHAFGGDLEAVNVFSGLVALRHAAGCDIAVTAMGPGVVGTSTALGFSALEQGQLLDAATALGGRAVACLRVSFADERARHGGISHHVLTALRVAARERATVVLPKLGPGEIESLRRQLHEAGVDARHDIVLGDGGAGVALLEEKAVTSSSMGRSLEEIPELFLAAAAAGAVAAGA
ncbi:MAG: DUF3866 family protein [Actinobacteria bacterium]|nr:DUF3866 family protein [Actinomycetota bacterium]